MINLKKKHSLTLSVTEQHAKCSNPKSKSKKNIPKIIDNETYIYNKPPKKYSNTRLTISQSLWNQTAEQTPPDRTKTTTSEKQLGKTSWSKPNNLQKRKDRTSDAATITTKRTTIFLTIIISSNTGSYKDILKN